MGFGDVKTGPAQFPGGNGKGASCVRFAAEIERVAKIVVHVSAEVIDE